MAHLTQSQCILVYARIVRRDALENKDYSFCVDINFFYWERCLRYYFYYDPSTEGQKSTKSIGYELLDLASVQLMQMHMTSQHVGLLQAQVH